MYVSYKNKVGLYQFLSADSNTFHRLSNNILVTGFYSPTYKLCFAIKSVIQANENIKQLEQTTLHAEISGVEQLQQNIVLIIGESYNKRHSQLYGYDRPTTPHQLDLKYKGQLIAFTNVVSSWNYTYESMIRLFSTYSIGDSGEWYDYPMFPTLFKKAGYHVTFITNQFACNLAKNRWDYSAGVIFNTPNLSDAQFDCRNTKTHDLDMDLINDYDSLKVYEGEHNLTIFHLYGQHVDYQQRYPHFESFFSPSDYDRPELSSEQLQVLAHYDNATLYNDKVVGQIIDLYTDKNAIVIYCPDHGEQCFDGNQSFGRSYSNSCSSITQQFEIPFWIWGSETFRASNPFLWNSITCSQNKAFMTDNLAQLLLYLGGISSKYYSNENNMLGSEYNESRPRLLREEIDYDKIIAE